MYEVDDIISKLPINQRQFFLDICEKDFEDMPLKYYLMEITDNNFLTFKENSEYSVFHLQQILVGIIKKDPSNIVQIVDLILVLSSLKEKNSNEVVIDNKNSIQNFQNETKIEEPKFEPQQEPEPEYEFVHAPANHLNKDVYALKDEVHKKEYLDIKDVSEFTKISIDIIEHKLFDQTLLYPFDKNKKGLQKTFKKIDIIKWYNSNKYDLFELR